MDNLFVTEVHSDKDKNSKEKHQKNNVKNC